MDIGIIRADDRSAPFFAAAARDVLLIKRCARCDRWLDPGATGCPGCGAADPRWEQAAGRGRLISWAVLPAGKPDPADRLAAPGPLVRPGLPVTPRLPGTSRLLVPARLLMRPACWPWWNSTRDRGCARGWRAPAATGTAGLRPGLRVTAHFVHPAEGESYPVFRPGE